MDPGCNVTHAKLPTPYRAKLYLDGLLAADGDRPVGVRGHSKKQSGFWSASTDLPLILAAGNYGTQV